MNARTIVVFMLIALGLNSSPRGSAATDSLDGLVAQVRSMKAQGKTRGEIAAFVTRSVDERIVSLNQSGRDERGGMHSAVYKQKKGMFDAWSKTGIGVDEPWSSAHWTWINRVGHCQENAHMAYHVLMMDFGSGAVIRELTCGDHVYVVLGVPPEVPGEVSIADLNRWPDAWLIDPWQGVCKPGREMGLRDWHMTQGGIKVMTLAAPWSYRVYKSKYAKWLQDAAALCGEWGDAGDRLVVTAVSGDASIRVGQVMSVRPAGVFKVTRKDSGGVRLDFRAAAIEGAAAGDTAWLNKSLAGNLVSAGLTRIVVNGKDHLQVTLVTSGAGFSFTREGLLTRSR